MALPLHLLRLFSAVAEHRGFSRAAEALRISQPAISKGVRALENQVGTPLIERGPGGIRLTEAGDLLAARARELFSIERAAEEELRAIRGLEHGRLGVAASTTIAIYHLPPLLASFRAAHPNVDLRLTSANTHDVLESLLRRDVDIALVEGPVDDARIEVSPWREEAMALVAAPSHPLARRGGAVSGDDLRGELFVVREPGSGTRDVAEALLAAIGVTPPRILEVGSTEAIKQVVAAGLGLAIVSRMAAADQLALGRLSALPVTKTGFTRMLSRLSLHGRRPSPTAAAFDRLLDEAADGGKIPSPAPAPLPA
jgi:DNA-binding transcriptional LysR family regulator